MNNLKKILPPRKLTAHKGDFGHIFVLAGSAGLTGAAYLTSQAGLLSGSGLVTLGIPKSLNAAMEVKLTEVMTAPLAETKEKTFSLKAEKEIKKFFNKIDALAIGPGISQNNETQKLVCRLLKSLPKPAVLDADGLNALAKNLHIIKNLNNSRLILTPHPGEMARLLNLPVSTVEENRIKFTKTFANRYNVVVVLKGYQTVIAAGNGETYINKTGNPGMASGGCGDVLTGMIASFLGQGIRTFDSAKLAVYLHGLAADYAVKEKGAVSLIASDILDKLPQAIKTVH